MFTVEKLVETEIYLIGLHNINDQIRELNIAQCIFVFQRTKPLCKIFQNVYQNYSRDWSSSDHSKRHGENIISIGSITYDVLHSGVKLQGGVLFRS